LNIVMMVLPEKGAKMMIEFYAAHKLSFWLGSLVLALVLCAAHYILFTKRPVSSATSVGGDLIQRMGLGELISHWLKIVSFFILMLTGVVMLHRSGESHLGPHHGFLGLFLLIILVINALAWRADIALRRYDWAWLQEMGGYFSRESKHCPAGRFNAGQKIFFWLMLAAFLILMITAIVGEHEPHHILGLRLGIAWSLHGITGCFATVMVIGHIYLSLLANPDSARTWLDGKISRAYMFKYHSEWMD